MDSGSSPKIHEDSPTLNFEEEEEEIPIPNGLRFMLESLKILTTDPLTPDNHLIWSSQIQTIFKANGYIKYLNSSLTIPSQYKLSKDGKTESNPSYKRWSLINCPLVAAVIATISPSIKPFVLKKATIADVWDSLNNRFQSQTTSRVMQLRDELHALTLKGDNIPHYITITKAIVDKLEAAGFHLADEEIMYYMINSLPGAYNGFKTAFRMKSDKTDLNTFYSLLISEEINLGRQNRTELASQNLASVDIHFRSSAAN